MSAPAQLDELIDQYFNGLLNTDEAAELNRQLDTSRKARDQFRARVAFHDALHQHFLDPEEVPDFSPTTSFGPEAMRRNGSGATNRVLVGFILGAFCALATALLWPRAETPPPAVVARVLSPDVEGPTSLMAGPFRAQDQFVEIVMENGAQLALEAGSEVEFLSADSLRLLRGSLGADVGPEARGFTVRTESGDIDHGTRFGVSVGESGVRTELFSGELEVHTPVGTHAFQGKQTLFFTSTRAPHALEGDVDPGHFPMPAIVDTIPLVQGHFEPGDQFTIRGQDAPLSTEWGGNLARIVTSHQEISPYKGRGMLQFLSTYKTVEASNRTVCDVNQWVDLSAYEDHQRRFRASMFVNRVAGDDETDTNFILMVSAHREVWPPGEGEGEDSPLGTWRTDLLTDEDPRTWERLELQNELPPGTRFLRINLGAQENRQNDEGEGEIEFDGHFVDHVQLELRMPARPALRDFDIGL